AKGTILSDQDSNPQVCFKKNIDSILDLLIPGESPGIKEPIVDFSLFFGPAKRNTVMRDWAALQAGERG
ncbi:hypothetical protein PPACK8108_LOCUS21068, partial [Phakopsora pachyrhizi]